jgi:hypothetical protein
LAAPYLLHLTHLSAHLLCHHMKVAYVTTRCASHVHLDTIQRINECVYYAYVCDIASRTWARPLCH